jgi:signal transduction histidine kinase
MRFAPIAAAIAAGAAILAAALWFGSKLLYRPATAPRGADKESGPAQARPASVLPLRRAAPVRPAAPPPPPPTDLNAVLGPLERRIRQRVRGKVRWRYSLLPELWPCRTEGGAVAVAVLDLVDAATAAMDADGTLIIGTRNFTFDAANAADYSGARIGQFARITVRDSGRGLTDVELAQIADPEVSVRKPIARAAAVMERLGGFLRVESAEGIGTAVHLYFARVSTAAEEPPTAQVAE